MRRIIHVLWLAGITGVAAVALGAAVRFDGTPVARDDGTTLAVSGTLLGLGPQDFTVRVRATGTATIQCVDPKGGEPDGRQSTTPVTATGEAMVPAAGIDNGRASFTVATAEPHVTGLSCPNDQWTAELADVTFRTVTVRVFQNGRVVHRRTWNP